MPTWGRAAQWKRGVCVCVFLGGGGGGRAAFTWGAGRAAACTYGRDMQVLHAGRFSHGRAWRIPMVVCNSKGSPRGPHPPMAGDKTTPLRTFSPSCPRCAAEMIMFSIPRALSGLTIAMRETAYACMRHGFVLSMVNSRPRGMRWGMQGRKAFFATSPRGVRAYRLLRGVCLPPATHTHTRLPEAPHLVPARP